MGRQQGRARGARVLVAIAVVVTLALGTVAWTVIWPRLSGQVQTVFVSEPDCATPREVLVTTTEAMRDAVRNVAETVPDPCVVYDVSAEASSVTTQKIQDGAEDAPSLWVADTSLVAQEATTGNDAAAVGEQLAWTPLVVAVPDGATAPDPLSWASVMLDDDSRLPDPSSSTVGQLALVLGLGEVDALPDGERATALTGIGGMLSRVTDEGDLLTRYAGQESAALFPTTEQQVFAADVGNLTVAVPEPATGVLDYTLVTNGSTDAEPVAALVAALRSEAGQATLRDAGFRTPGDPSPVVADGPPADVVRATASAQDVQSAEAMWQAIVRPTRLLNIVDVSGSMRLPAVDGGASRIEVAATASTGANRLLADHNAVGLWTFSTDESGGQDYAEVVPVEPLGESGQRDALAEALAELPGRLSGDTGLYDTIDAAYRAMLGSYDPEAENIMVVFTDGLNDDPGGGLDLASLKSRLDGAANEQRPVTVLLIGMGGVDAEQLKQVAAVVPTSGGGGGAVFTIDEPQDIGDVYVSMLLRRLPGQG
ncbi:VWA domain-containing protein [Phycicoccus sp. CSK15P-2]|uniref:substrate-binding and VWA domain-containing protein n=1 Tax=Phycicoccus sp. CSK15P-2 TaxID=2807627 RepID=UPI0019516F50|nr:substrate-binding and VWA domain-containing protein [Phycicoccus sp. CSK15P-2]MBM6403904.1 VWA domain-containing protein [Phycicoccus sp. CSK15P-2]